MAKTGPRKRRTREHVIADLAVNHVERFVLRCGHTLNRITYDYGLDAALTTYSSQGEVESGVIWVQMKATDHLQRLRGIAAVAVRVERKDLLTWIRELHPVVLGVFDAVGDQAYWLHIQGMREGGKLFELARAGASVTLHVPLDQVINEQAIAEFRRLKVQSQGGW